LRVLRAACAASVTRLVPLVSRERGATGIVVGETLRVLRAAGAASVTRLVPLVSRVEDRVCAFDREAARVVLSVRWLG
jgi:hypothetical protein